MGLLHCRSHLQLSWKTVYKLCSDFFFRQLATENAPCGLSTEWRWDGSAIEVVTPGVSHLLIQFTLTQIKSCLSTTWWRVLWGMSTLWLGKSDTSFTWGSWYCTVKWVVQSLPQPNIKPRVNSQNEDTFQNRNDFSPKPYGLLLWISHQGFYRVYTASWSVTDILQTIRLIEHK